MKLPQLPGPPFPGLSPSPVEVTQSAGLMQSAQSYGMPVGAVIAFAGKILTSSSGDSANQTDMQHFGWKVCDGSTLQIDGNRPLYDAIGTLYGTPGEGQFLLPDYSGYFLRGVDAKGTVDQDQSARTVPTSTSSGGTATGVGSEQPYALHDHTHKYLQVNTGTLPVGTLPPPATAAPPTLPVPPNTETLGISVNAPIKVEQKNISETEVRPVNMYVHWLIKCLPDCPPNYPPNYPPPQG